jgi:hypothetical protein
VDLKDLVVDGLENFLRGNGGREEGKMPLESGVNVEGSRLWIHACSEHAVLKELLLREVFSVVDNLIVNNLSHEGDG